MRVPSADPKQPRAEFGLHPHQVLLHSGARTGIKLLRRRRHGVQKFVYFSLPRPPEQRRERERPQQSQPRQPGHAKATEAERRTATPKLNRNSCHRFSATTSSTWCSCRALYICSVAVMSKVECTRQVAIQSRGEFLPWKYRRVTWRKFGEAQQQKTGVFSTQQRTLVKKGWQAQPPAMRNRIRNAEDESQATEARCSRRPGTQLATWPWI